MLQDTVDLLGCRFQTTSESTYLLGSRPSGSGIEREGVT
jgi:hypothetical protein